MLEEGEKRGGRVDVGVEGKGIDGTEREGGGGRRGGRGEISKDKEDVKANRRAGCYKTREQ